MNDDSDRRAVLPAPIQYRNPQSAASPRYDDEHRGPAVTDAYELSRCWIDLMEVSRNWPLPNDLPPLMVEFAQRVPEDQRQEWLRAQSASEEVIRKISRAMRSGELPIWVAPKDAPERLVAPSAMIEVDGATIKAGCYRPPNDRGWLYGRPLFVKINDWKGFVATTQSQMTAISTRTTIADDPGDAGWIVGLPDGWIAAKIAAIRFCRMIEERLATRDLAPWIGQPDVSEYLRVWGGTALEARHSIKLNEHAPAAFQRALLAGTLDASVFDGHAFRPLPKAAFVRLPVVRNALVNGVLELDPLWPDEWWPWNCRDWAIPKAQFEAWLASAEATRVDGLPATVRLTDEDAVPSLTTRPPSERVRVSFSEAVSWVAFGLALEAERLEAAWRWDLLAGGDLQEVQRMFARAAAEIVSAGADGRVAFFGRHVENRQQTGATVAVIEALQLDDYRGFMIGDDKLIYGDGLQRTYSAKHSSHLKASEREDLFTHVFLSRADLVAQFSPAIPQSLNRSRSPSVKSGRPPSDEDILAKADEMKARISDGRMIAKTMRLEAGFENVATTHVRDLIKGRYKPGRSKPNDAV